MQPKYNSLSLVNLASRETSDSIWLFFFFLTFHGIYKSIKIITANTECYIIPFFNLSTLTKQFSSCHIPKDLWNKIPTHFWGSWSRFHTFVLGDRSWCVIYFILITSMMLLQRKCWALWKWAAPGTHTSAVLMPPPPCRSACAPSCPNNGRDQQR